MKIRYEFATGEVSEIEVSEELGRLIEEMTHQAALRDRAETRRHVSLDKLLEAGLPLADDNCVETLAERAIDHAALLHAMEQLLPQQKELLLKVYFEGRSYADVARDEGVDRSAIRKKCCAFLKKSEKTWNRPSPSAFPVA